MLANKIEAILMETPKNLKASSDAQPHSSSIPLLPENDKILGSSSSARQRRTSMELILASDEGHLEQKMEETHSYFDIQIVQ
ncbi:hypothetical protein P5673_017040, partial [Acropora cervicornis]